MSPSGCTPSGSKGCTTSTAAEPGAARVGLISDTHGLLRPEALGFLRGCDAIVHAGDIGDAGILEQLAALAPVTAVRGNNDRAAWADRLPETALLRIGGVHIHVLHDIAQFVPPATARVIVSGHSHTPCVVEKRGVLHVNPGSAGPRRFKLPVAIGELIVAGCDVQARVVLLEVGATLARSRAKGGEPP